MIFFRAVTQPFGKCLINGCLIALVACVAQAAAADEQRSSQAADWLVQIGKRFYEEQMYEDALVEFKKALLVQPDHREAKRYVELLSRRPSPEAPAREPAPEVGRAAAGAEPAAAEDSSTARSRDSAIDSTLTQWERTMAPPQRRPAHMPAEAGAPSVALPLIRAQERSEAEKREQALERALEGAFRALPAVRPTTPRLPAPRAGSGVQVAVDGERIPLEQPVRGEGATLSVPLKDVAAALGYSVINLGKGEVQLISPEGEATRVALASQDPALFVSEEELRRHFALRTRYDAADRTLYLQSPSPSSFRAYTIPKPPEQLQAEEAAQQLVERIEQQAEAEGPVPEAAKPSVVLNSSATYSYDDPHAQPPLRSLTSTVQGRAYGWDVAYESVRKDLSGIFQHDYTYLNLFKPGFFVGAFDQQTSLAPLRSQFDDFHGVKLRKLWDEEATQPTKTLPYRPLDVPAPGGSATTLAWGTTEQNVSGTGGTVTYLGDLYQAQHEWAAADGLRFKSALLYLDNEANYLERSGASEFPRTNLVMLGDAGLRLPGGGWLSTQLARADYKPDNQPDVSVEDWNWRAAFDWRQPRHWLKVAYEFVGEDYASLGDPRTYQDYQGLTAFGTYRLTDRWSVSGTLLRYRNNLNDDPEEATNQNQALTLSTSFQPRRDQSISLRYSNLMSNPEGGPSTGSSSQSRAYGFDYSFPLPLRASGLASYEYFRTEAPAASDSISHSAGTTVFKSFGRGSSWSVSERLRKTFRELEADALSLDTSLNLSLQLSPALLSYGNASYLRDLTQGAEHADTLTTSLGLRYNTISDTTLGLEYEIGPYNLDTESGRWPRNWSVLFLVTKRFGFSTPPGFGRIEGIVFHDDNANGALDADEAPAEDAVAILVDGQRRAATDAQGRFAFGRVVPGTQAVQLDLSNLDPAWSAPQPKREVAVRRRRTARLAFPLVRGGGIRGKVFIDENGDGAFQETEEPLEGIAVILLPAEDFRRTDADGAFQFDYLAPGDYTVKLYVEDLPGGYELTSSQTVEATVRPGQVTEAMEFAVRLSAPVQQF
jgi:hypothetical protein